MTERDPRVSVLIAAYNAEAFVPRAIASALAQQGPSLEVVVVDDASTDGTARVVEAEAAKDDRVRLVPLPQNAGPAAARNAGLAVCAGAFVAVLDADDAFVPGRLTNLLRIAEARGADIVADRFAYYDASSGIVSGAGFHWTEAAQLSLKSFLAQARPYAANPDYGLLKPMFRRAFLREAGIGYPEHTRHGEDFLLVVAALLAGARYFVTPEQGYLYTTRDSGWSRTRIDYGAQIAQSEALIGSDAMRTNPEACRLLRERIRALRRLESERKVKSIIRERDVTGLVRACITDARLMPEIGRMVMRKALR